MCRWNGLNAMNGLNAIILTITVAAHRSTILDEHEHEPGEQHDYFTCGYASCYGGVGLMLRLMKPVIALEGYGGSVDLYSGIRMVGILGVGSDIGAVETSEYIGAVETSEFTVVSGMGLEVAAPTSAVSELMVALLVVTLLAVSVWLGVLMVCWSRWDWIICLLVLCSVVFDVEDGVMKDHQAHHHQKHHHKHCYACLSPAPTVWSPLWLCTRQLSYYSRTYSCFQLNGSTEVTDGSSTEALPNTAPNRSDGAVDGATLPANPPLKFSDGAADGVGVGAGSFAFPKPSHCFYDGAAASPSQNPSENFSKPSDGAIEGVQRPVQLTLLAWLYGVLCLWICMLLRQWYESSLQPMSWPNQGEKNDNRRAIRPQQEMQIFVKVMTGRTITLTVTRDTNIKEIREMLQNREGVHPSQQRILYGGKQLGDGKCLDDYCILDESTLHLMLRLRGGEGLDRGHGSVTSREKRLGDGEDAVVEQDAVRKLRTER